MTNPTRRDVLKATAALAVAPAMALGNKTEAATPSPTEDLAFAAAQWVAEEMDRLSASWHGFQASRTDVVECWANGIRTMAPGDDAIYFAYKAVWDKNAFGADGSRYGVVGFHRVGNPHNPEIIAVVKDGDRTVTGTTFGEFVPTMNWKWPLATERGAR